MAGTFHPQPGGVSVYVERLTSALADLCEVGLVTEPQHERPVDRRIACLTVANLTYPSTVSQWDEAAGRLRDAVWTFEPDVVHFSTAGAAVYCSLVPRQVAVATVHGNDLTAPWQRTPGRDTRGLIVRNLNECDHVFAVSGHTAGLLARSGVDAPTSIVTAGCDLAAFRPLPHTAAIRVPYGLAVGVPLVLTVGRLAPRKGHLTVLAALERLSLPVHWAVVGSGPERDALLRAVDESGMRGRVTLLEHVTAQELPLLYNACDLFVLTPDMRQIGELVDSEGFGLVYLEAAACGKPVVASSLAGCREAVVDGSTGLLVPPGDADALAAAISRVLTDRDLAHALGRAGAAFVRASGGWARLARETSEVYGELAAPRQDAAELSMVVGPL